MGTTTNATYAARIRAVRRAYAQLEDLLQRNNVRLEAGWHGDVWLVHKDEEEPPKNGLGQEYGGIPLP